MVLIPSSLCLNYSFTRIMQIQTSLNFFQLLSATKNYRDVRDVNICLFTVSVRLVFLHLVWFVDRNFQEECFFWSWVQLVQKVEAILPSENPQREVQLIHQKGSRKKTVSLTRLFQRLVTHFFCEIENSSTVAATGEEGKEDKNDDLRHSQNEVPGIKFSTWS